MSDQIDNPTPMTKPKKKPAATVINSMRWRCVCGAKNWTHRTTCYSCGGPRPEPING